jgi:hypothetical protein
VKEAVPRGGGGVLVLSQGSRGLPLLLPLMIIVSCCRQPKTHQQRS